MIGTLLFRFFKRGAEKSEVAQYAETLQEHSIRQYDRALRAAKRSIPVSHRAERRRALGLIRAHRTVSIILAKRTPREKGRALRSLRRYYLPSCKREPRFLYALASAYAVAARPEIRIAGISTETSRSKALVWLGISLALDTDRRLYPQFLTDPDFARLQSQGDPEALLDAIRDLQRRKPGLGNSRDVALFRAVNAALKQAGWK